MLKKLKADFVGCLLDVIKCLLAVSLPEIEHFVC